MNEDEKAGYRDLDYPTSGRQGWCPISHNQAVAVSVRRKLDRTNGHLAFLRWMLVVQCFALAVLALVIVTFMV